MQRRRGDPDEALDQAGRRVTGVELVQVVQDENQVAVEVLLERIRQHCGVRERSGFLLGVCVGAARSLEFRGEDLRQGWDLAAQRLHQAGDHRC